MALRALATGAGIVFLVQKARESGISILNDCHNAKLSVDKRIIRIAAHAFALLTQAALVGVDFFIPARGIKICTHVVTGVTEIIDEGFQLSGKKRSYEDYLKAFATVIFRIGDVGKVTGETDTVKQLSEIAILISSSILDFEGVTLRIKRWIVPNNPLPSDITKTNKSIILICPITRQRIRKIMVIIKTANLQNPIYYEKEAIKRWFRDSPSQKPPNWPRDVTVSSGQLAPCLWLQDRINERLAERKKDFIFKRADKLHFCDPAISDVRLGDDLIERTKDMGICLVTVNTEEHDFYVDEEMETKISRKAEVKSDYVFPRHKAIKDCLPAARALLGSADATDRRAMQEMMKDRYILTIHVSMDGKFYHINVSIP